MHVGTQHLVWLANYKEPTNISQLNLDADKGE
jgi:hypothetical protein